MTAYPELVLDNGKRTLVLQVLLNRVDASVYLNDSDAPWYRRGTALISACALHGPARITEFRDAISRRRTNHVLLIDSASVPLSGNEVELVQRWLDAVYQSVAA